VFSHDFSVIFVLLCIFLSIPGIFLVLFILFSVLLIVRILNLLGNVFEIKCAYLRYLMCWDYLFWHLFGLYWIIFMFVIFGNVHFTLL